MLHFPDGADTARPAPTYRMNRTKRVVNAIIRLLARLGIGPFHLLDTRGRKTGRAHTIPVTLVEQNGRRWLVAPYGAVSWVHNVRAAGRATLRRGRERRECAVREVGAIEAGPVLKRYIEIASATRPYFHGNKDSPVEDFIAEAHLHPVFELTNLRRQRA